MDKSEIKNSGDGGIETCFFKRNFLTSLSDIPLKVNEDIRVMVGYKMFLAKKEESPAAKGYSGEEMLKWRILDAGSSALMVATSSIVCMVILANFW